MADDTEDDVLELTDDQQIDDEIEDQDDHDDQTGDADGGDDGEEETVISFGDEEPAPGSEGEGETPLIKHLRAELRETKKQIAELRKATTQPQTIEVGEKPTLAGCDYDEERFEAELDGWKERKAKAEQAESDAQRQAQEANEQWKAELGRYEKGKKSLSRPDFEKAEETVTTVLDQVQQAVIVKAADNSAAFIYALAKAPGQLERLSQIKDPLKLAAAVAKLEGTLKVTTRKKAPALDTPARGNASVATASADKKLERLEKEAARTGDRTALINYKRELKSKAKS